MGILVTINIAILRNMSLYGYVLPNTSLAFSIHSLNHFSHDRYQVIGIVCYR